VGNGKLTLGEQRTHFALWALLKSPLLIGADLRSINPDSLAILKAREVIAVNQDPLGVAGDLIWVQGASRVSGGSA
jgi:alpha-galactosidase